MKNLLVITASARGQESLSRVLSSSFIERWQKSVPESAVVFRELANSEVPHLTEEWLDAAATAESERTSSQREILAFSDSCISELLAADAIVLATPMYNFSIPSTLKAYIDQVMRVKETFTVENHNGKQVYNGLLQNKSVFLLLSRGGYNYEIGQSNEHLNFQNTYLKVVLGIMGLKTVYDIIIEGTSSNGAVLQQSLSTAENKIEKLIEQELRQNAK